jgi:exonuclease SbcC
LPHINNEIANILQDVVGFTVELEADPGSNDMDVYINYGDSRRVIECGSGMEKMMSSLAIRVALINISSLPKSDILVIDEGFGALDEMNVEACNKLLESLKKWFKNILVISHVDAVKDAVDDVLDISRKNKDARVFYE